MTTATATDVRLPAPEAGSRQVKSKVDGRGTRKFAIHNGRFWAVIGRLTRSRVLYKRYNEREHSHINRQGTGLNLEMVCQLDQLDNPPTHLELRQDGKVMFKVSWDVIRAYAHAALNGNDWVGIHEDVDRQVIIPWTAFKGQAPVPPAPRNEPADTNEEEADQLTLDVGTSTQPSAAAYAAH